MQETATQYKQRTWKEKRISWICKCEGISMEEYDNLPLGEQIGLSFKYSRKK